MFEKTQGFRDDRERSVSVRIGPNRQRCARR